MPDSSGPILEFKDVSLQYGQTWALRKIGLVLKPGESRIIFGEAGSGKTTLLKAVVGLVRVDGGSIHLFDEEVTSLAEHELYSLRGHTGIVFQEGGLFDSLTIRENVEYPLVNQQIRGGKKKEPSSENEVGRRVREALRFVELEQTLDKFPSELSGGMRRRVGIARAIVTEPPLVLYDSPTAGLDPITANLIMALILKERDVRNSASLIVTHRYQDGELMSDFRWDAERQELVRLNGDEEKRRARDRTKLIVMKQGEIVFSGSREELERSTDRYVKRFIRQEGNYAQQR